MLSIMHYKTYILTYTLQFFCDQQPLKHHLGSQMINRKVLMQALTNQEYNAEIKYIKGTSNSLADMLRRLPGSSEDQAPQKMSVREEGLIPDVSDRSYEIGVINSNEC